MKIVFATGNKGKLREAAEILGPGHEVLSPAEFGIDGDVEETGATLQENSRIKARFINGACGIDCFADDTGLEVDSLGGAPGIYSARYAGEGHDSEANMSKLLSELAKLGPEADRKARFRTVVTLILNGEEHFFEGTLEGRIALSRSGRGGFGYDPIFIPDAAELEAAGIRAAAGTTLAELSEEEKNAISHRGKAVRAMAAFLAR